MGTSKVNVEYVTESQTVVQQVAAIKGKVITTSNWNNGTIAVTTDYGVYSVYRNQECVEVQLLAVFTGDE